MHGWLKDGIGTGLKVINWKYGTFNEFIDLKSKKKRLESVSTLEYCIAYARSLLTLTCSKTPKSSCGRPFWEDSCCEAAVEHGRVSYRVLLS